MGRKKTSDVAQADIDAANDVADNHANGTANGEPEVVESKADKFRRLANKRVSKAEKALLAVQRLASKATYAYTPEQAEKLSLIVANAANKVIEAFKPEPAATAEEASYF